MKNYIITDRLNANAVNARYGRPVSECRVDRPVLTFSAASAAEAAAHLEAAIESGIAGYSDLNPERVSAKVWRTKEFYGGQS